MFNTEILRFISLHCHCVVLVAVAVAVACTQTVDHTDIEQSAITDVTDPLQFESATDWRVTQGRAQSLTLTTRHTRGTSALAITAPQGYTRLDSVVIPSSNPQASAIGAGTSLNLDIALPTQQANPYWLGAVQAYLTAPSRNIFNAYLGQVELTGMRTGVFTTLHFRVPDYAGNALHGATYNDLTIGIVINVPSNTTGVYLLDNLRVKAPLSPRPTEISQITSGQAILLEASRTYAPPASQVASTAFAPGVIQIPQRLHLVAGRTGTGTASFEFKLGAAPPTLCNFSAAASRVDYVFASCVDGTLPGDLVPADFVRLAVGNGEPAAGPTKISAQIALNLCGDELVIGLPPVPTFFGTTGAEVRDALDAFVQQQRSWKLTDNQIVRLPIPAIPIGAPVIRNGTTSFTESLDNDPPFSIGSRLTGSDLADAGWHVNGSLAAPVNASGARDTHFDVDLGVDVWVLDRKLDNVVGVTGSIDTQSPPFNGTTIPPTTSTSQFCYQHLGISQVCKSELNANLVDIDEPITLVSLNYWVFHVGVGGRLVLKADVTANITSNGFTVTFLPHLSLSARLEGGLAVAGFLGGGLFGEASLITIDAPISASVNAVLRTAPTTCNIHVSESLNAAATVSTGGGRIGYYLEGGLTCGFFSGLCWRDEEDLFTWDGFGDTFEILPGGPLANQDIPMSPALCTPAGLADGGISYPVAGESFNPGDVSFLSGGFTRTFVNSDDVIILPTHFDCHRLVWSSSNASDAITTVDLALGTNVICFTSIKYGTSGPRTITLTASDPFLGNGFDARTTTVVVGNPTTAPNVTMTEPTPFRRACNSIAASGSATDPGGLATTLEWFEVELPSLTTRSRGTGSSVSLFGGNLARLVATNSAGQKAAVERPVGFGCPN